MATEELHYRSLIEISALIAARALSPFEVTRALLDRISRLDPKLHSFSHVSRALALAQASRAETEILRGEHRGPLHGVPIAVKDLCFTKTLPTAGGTRFLVNWKPSYNATVVERLENAGAVLLGKLQMTEGASAQHHPEVSPPVNPWNEKMWPGASSSGAGVATAAGFCYASIASDTGGSIRFPSAANGVTGIKPTWGRVSRYGVFPLSEPLDHIGPMARSAEDAAAILGAIAGIDAMDPTTLSSPVPNYVAGLKRGVIGLRIGVDADCNADGVEAPVVSAINDTLTVLQKLGATIEEITFPPTGELETGWLPVASVGAALAHEKDFPAHSNEYGPALRGMIEAGHALGGTDLTKILIAGQIFKGRLASLFENVDLLLTPVMYSQVPTLEQMAVLGDQPEAGTRLLRFTAPFNFSGHPTITLPCALDSRGLPISFQLIGPHLSEELLCAAAHAYQSVTDWHRKHPPI